MRPTLFVTYLGNHVVPRPQRHHTLLIYGVRHAFVQ
jgi:hypothetical protein